MQPLPFFNSQEKTLLQAFYGSLGILLWKCGSTSSHQIDQDASPSKGRSSNKAVKLENSLNGVTTNPIIQYQPIIFSCHFSY